MAFLTSTSNRRNSASSKAQGASIGKQDHKTVPLRHGGNDGRDFLSCGRSDLPLCPGRAATRDATRVERDEWPTVVFRGVRGGPQNCAQKRVGVGLMGRCSDSDVVVPVGHSLWTYVPQRRVAEGGK